MKIGTKMNLSSIFEKCERSLYAYQGLHGLVSFTCTFAKSEYPLFKSNSKASATPHSTTLYTCYYKVTSLFLKM